MSTRKRIVGRIVLTAMAGLLIAALPGRARAQISVVVAAGSSATADMDAVARLYEAKLRPSDKPIALLLSDADQLGRVATLPPRFKCQFGQLITRFWPGGLTLVLP